MATRTDRSPGLQKLSRRTVLKGGAAASVMVMLAGKASFDTFFQKRYREMTPAEKRDVIARIEAQEKKDFGKEVEVGSEGPLPGVVYGYALNLSKCQGTRRCVEACVAENNQSRDPQIQYIRVLELEKGKTIELDSSDHYFDPKEVPEAGKMYLPIQCHQCDNPPCTKACPVEATWTEPDGITVIDYDWCIGCRYCMAACPYWARHFNWAEPKIPKDELNVDQHYLGNRPRPKGVVEKCTFCIQRTRKGRLPACLEACPTGARVFGNLLDPESDIRYVLENKRVFRLKEELGTDPRFWYYTD